MNRKVYLSVLCVIFIMALGACGGNGSTTPPPVETIAVTSGSGQSTVVSTPFMNVLVATVSTGGTPNAGVSVTFAAPGSGASGTFAGGGATAMVTTDANGKATSPVFTANATVGGPYTVTATASGVTTPAGFSLTNTAEVVTSSNFSFYLTGLEAINNAQGPNFYAVAGSVIINSNGTVTGGVEDYNDAFGLTSAQPGDSITGGTLSNPNPATGMATLTLITNNSNLGVNGTETLGVQYVNANHALVVQFDGSATSSGSLDLQTIPNPLVAPSGSFAFTFSGVDPGYNSLVVGGLFQVAGGSLSNGVFDYDDNGAVTLGTNFTGTVSPPDQFGRGTITNTLIATTIDYYIVTPQVIRLIDMDATDSLVGSAYSQGTGSFTNASLGASVFGVASNSWGNLYSAAGQFTTSPQTAVTAQQSPSSNSNFTGVGDDDELGIGTASGSSISGTYTIGTNGFNGYGSMTITVGDLGDVSQLGIYMVDPTVNILDPNNTTSGLGGALVVELDTSLNGTGVILPQSDPATASFAGNYAFGAQAFSDVPPVGWEYDLLGQGQVAAGVLTADGIISDPFGVFNNGVSAGYTGVSFTGTATPDGVNLGRYTMFTSPLAVDIPGLGVSDLSVVIYQASGDQLIWMEEDTNSLFGGTIQQSNLPAPAAIKKAAAKTVPKQK
jgi:hypothetical protein